MGFIYSSLAQQVERAAVNRVVVGSSPTRGASSYSGGYAHVYVVLSCYLTAIIVGSTVGCRRSTYGSQGFMRVWCLMASTPAFQAGGTGSSPVTRSILNYCGVEQLVARQVHGLEVVSSNLTAASTRDRAVG